MSLRAYCGVIAVFSMGFAIDLRADITVVSYNIRADTMAPLDRDQITSPSPLSHQFSSIPSVGFSNVFYSFGGIEQDGGANTIVPGESATSFGFTFEKSLGTLADVSDHAASVGTFEFTAAEGDVYSISGVFEQVGTTRMVLDVRLYRIGEPDVYISRQYSNNASNMTFAVGGTQGDFENILAGSATGILQAGTYTFSWTTYIGNDQIGQGGPGVLNQGNGQVNLSVVSGNIPTASAWGVIVMAMLLLAVGSILWRRNSDSQMA